MRTPCPCPRPPGGSVICAGNQFAYCHRIRGELRSGCIPIDASEDERPTQSNIVMHMDSALHAAKIPDWGSRFVIHSQIEEVGGPGRLIEGNLEKFLYEAMSSGRIVQLIGVRHAVAEVLLFRFPSIWSRMG